MRNQRGRQTYRNWGRRSLWRGINSENIGGDGHQLEEGGVMEETSHTSMEDSGETGRMKEYDVRTEMPSSGEIEKVLMRQQHVG